MTLLAALAAGCAGITGAPAGTTLAPLPGETTFLATPGEVVDGKDATGFLSITASDVTLLLCRVRGGACGPAISVGPFTGNWFKVWTGNWHDSGAPVEP